MNAPKPGSPEEAAARRDVGKGPFSVEKAEVYVANKWPAARVVDAAGNPFAYVMLADGVGGDLTAAKARATRIAEALNRSAFGPGEEKLSIAEFERRAGVIVGHRSVYPGQKDGR